MSWNAAADDRPGYGYDQPDVEDDIPSEEGFMQRPKWLSNKILIIIIIILFFLGLAFLIAGSIMLGIGVSKSHTNCPTITATPYYATIESTKITYADVLNNYQKAVDTITDQIRAALSFSPSNQMAILGATANADPYITVLGLSQSPRGSVMAVVGMAYTSADAPPLTTVETDLNNGQNLTLYHAGSTAATSSDQQMCSIVSVYQMNNGTTVTPKTTSFWTNPPNSQGTTTTAGPTTIGTSTPCVCPTATVCPSPVVCPTPIVCPTSTVCPTAGLTTSATSPTTTSKGLGTSSTSQTTASTHTTATFPTTTTTTPTTAPCVCPTPIVCPTPTVCPTTGPTASTSPTISTSSPTASTTGTTTTTGSTTTSKGPGTSPTTLSTATSPTTTTSTPITTTGTTPCVCPTTTCPTIPPSTSTSSTSTTSQTTVGTSSSASLKTTTSTPASTTSAKTTSTSTTGTTSKTTSPTSPSTTTSTSPTTTTVTTPTSTGSTTTKTTPSTTLTTQSSTKTTSGSTSTAPSTTTSTTVAMTTTTSTTPPTTTTACIPVTTPSPRPGARDIVVLLDDSNAVGKAANYNQVTSWLGKQLFPQWPVSSEKWEAAPAQYALKEYNLLLDFDANNVYELVTAVTTSVYSGRNLPSVTKGLKSTLGLTGRPGVHRVILLFSASSNLTDLESALPLAEQAKGQGDDIITMALGGADSGALGLLASGPDYIFSANGFIPTADQATAITDLIQGGSRTTAGATTTTPSTTSSPPIVDFPCHPDIAVLVDTSEAVPTQEEYERQLSFIADQLAPTWSISPKAVETEIVVYSTSYQGFIGDHDFTYANYHEFSDVVHQYDYFYNRVSPASINGTLNYYASTIDNRRGGRQPTTLLFAYSGDKADIVATRSTLPAVGNLIVVGMGSQTQYLSLLTGNVITGMDYGDQLIQQINSLLCSPSTPAPLPTTQVQTTTAPPSTTTPSTTTSTTTAGTTITPQTCPDCIPDEANILIAMDSSTLMAGGKLDQLKSFVNSQLTANWTHSERLAVLGFDTRTRFSAPVDFGDLNSMAEFHQLVAVSPQLADPPSLTSAFQHALNNFHPIAKFGQQKSVIFTASADPTDIANASSYAALLSQRGIVVLVGMNLTNVGDLQKLAPSVIPWPDLTNSSGIADQINQGLAGAFLNYTTVQPSTSTLATGTTTSATTPTTTTTPGTTTVFTASPAICSRDVILLLDESNAYPDMASFNQVKTWLIKTLVPLWEVNPAHIAVAPYGFANKTFDDLGGNFLENSQAELETLINYNLRYLPTTGSSVHYGLSKAVGIATRPGAAVVLVSASDAADDIDQAMDYAKQLKMNGGTVITLSVGPNFSGQMPKLSSGLSFFFYSRDFTPSNEIAMDIADVLCSSAPPVTTTPGITTPSTTTTTTTAPSSPFPCTVDVAFLFDNSGRNSNSSVFNMTVDYVADQLIQNWVVDSNHTEAAIVMANSILPITDSQSWRYRDRDELQETLHQMGHDFFGGAPSIYNLLEGLQEVAPSRRTFHPLTAVMFTYSTDQADVIQSIGLANSLGVNIIAVGLGTSDANVLGLLTGNIVTGMPLGDQLTAWIDSAICNPKPPVATVAPTTSYVTTTPTTSTSTTSTSTATATTTAGTTTTPQPPEGCPDCYPDMANILILVDNSFEQSTSTFSNQIQVVQNLVSNWNHMERIALGSYATSLSQLINYDDLASTDLHGLQIIISNIQQSRSEEDLGKSLHQATSIVPNPLYGEQRTIVFTTTPGANDKATQAGENLRGKGQLIVVGIGMADVSGLASLASPGDAIPWGDVDDTSTVVQDILGAIGATTRRPTESTTSGTVATTTTGSTAATTTLPPNVISCQKDILLLIDESNAFGGQDNFSKTKTWIVNTLLPTWNINPSHVAAIASGYANKSWNNIGGDFGDVGSVAELQTMINGQLFYLANRTPSLTYGLKNAVAVSRPQMVTILVSASEGADDINMAYNYAVKLKEYGAAVITLFVGPTSKGYLGQLSSGSNFSFTSTDYSPSAALANQISAQICGPEPIFTTTEPPTTTTLPTTTVTTAPPPFNCNPDVAFLFDSSAFNSNDSTIAAVVNFVADNVVKNWAVNPQTTEAAPVFATSGHSLYGRNYWRYANRGELQDALHTMAGYGVFQGNPSVKALLSSLQTIVQHRRQTAPLTAVMFTFSTDYQDVVSSLSVEQKLGANIVAVGLGSSDLSTLGLLTGNVILPTALGDDLANFINSAICNPKAPISQVTTSPAVPSTTSSSSTTTTTATTTTVIPEGCPDCYPPMANLLLMIDNSANQTAATFSDQKQAVLNLISTWNHFERFSLATYADSLSPIIGYNDNATLDTLQKVINAIQQTTKPADLGRSLHMATGMAPVNVYGIQQTILFTTTVDSSDKATASAKILQREGQLVVVGVAMADASALTGLASPGSAIAWSNVNDIQGVVQEIMADLGAATRAPTESTTSGTAATTTTASTTARTTLPPNVISCQKDVLLLIDTSNSFGGADNFTATKNWIVNSLVPTWNVDPSHVAAIAFGFANKSWNNIGGDFGDVGSVSEFQKMINGQLYYTADRGHALAYGLKNAVAVSRPQTVVILISASEDPTDIGDSIQYATKLKEYGGAVITLAVGPTAKGYLGQLSSGLNYSYVSKDYAVSAALASQISAQICGPEPLFTTTQPPTTTALPTTTVTTAPPPFNCNPDVAFLFDSSAVNSNDSTIAAVVNFVADNVVKSWAVNLQATEAAPVFATTGHSLYGRNYWDYANRGELQDALHTMAGYGVFQGDPSVKALLNALQSIVQHRRQSAPLTAVMFTFSTDYQDVVNSLPIEKNLGANIVAVGLGSSDLSTLGLLTGNVILPTTLGDDLAGFINSAICNPKVPLSQVTTTTALPTTTRASTPTAAPLPTTTVTPEGCPDCVPAMANLLLMIDNSANQTADTFSDQKQAVLNLISTWNHFERFSLATYADSLSPIIGYNDNITLATLQKIINEIQQTTKAADLGRSLHMATGIAPVSFYGQQKTILFTTTLDNSDKATTAAGVLQKEGQLIAVGVAMADVSSLTGLASPGSAIAWSNVNDTQGVVNNIMQDLLPMTTVSTTRSSTTTVTRTTTVGSTGSSSTVFSSTSGAPTSSSSMAPTTTSTVTVPATTKATTTSAAPICTKDLILLMDDSNAIPNQDNFNQLKSWIISTFLPRLQTFIQVDPVSFDDKMYQDIGQGFLPGNVVGFPMNDMYLYQSKSGPNITKALQKSSTITGPDGPTSTILISASSASGDVATAVPYATQMKSNGVFITLLVGSTGDGLLPLASGSDMSFSTAGFSPDDTTLNAILTALCPGSSTASMGTSTTPKITPSPVVSSSTTAMGSTVTSGTSGSPSSSTASSGTIVTTSSTATTSASTSTVTGPTTTRATTMTAAPICTKDLILLMDDSNAIPNQDNFNQLKTWIIQSFLARLQSFIQVDPVSFDDKMYQDIGQGFLPGNVVGFPMNDMYNYNGNAGPNITKALQKASTIQGPDGPTSTLLISASSAAGDVASAVPYATQMKSSGVFITLLVGSTGDGLLPLASGSDMSFSAPGFTPDDTTLNAILMALCPGSSTGGPTTTSTSVPVPLVTTTVPLNVATTASSTTIGGKTALGPTTTSVTTGSSSTASPSVTTSTGTSTATVTTVTSGQAPTTTVDLYIPTKEDIVIVFDTSNDVNGTTVSAQQQLVLALCANWTHFDRVGLFSAANGDQALAHYQDLQSLGDLQALLPALIPMPAFPDLDKALKFVTNSYPLEAGMTSRDVIFFTASTDTDEITRAQQSATTVKSLGRLITVGIGIADPSILAPLASTNSTVAFTDFTDFTSTAAQINQLLL